MPRVIEYIYKGEDVRKKSFFTVIIIKKISFYIDELSSFIIEEWANFLKISLSVLTDIGYWVVITALIKCGLKMASIRSPIILTA